MSDAMKKIQRLGQEMDAMSATAETPTMTDIRKLTPGQVRECAAILAESMADLISSPKYDAGLAMVSDNAKKLIKMTAVETANEIAAQIRQMPIATEGKVS